MRRVLPVAAGLLLGLAACSAAGEGFGLPESICFGPPDEALLSISFRQAERNPWSSPIDRAVRRWGSAGVDWLLLADHGLLRSGVLPAVSFHEGLAEVSFDDAPGECIVFRETLLGSVEAPGDDPVSWCAVFAAPGSLRECLEADGRGGRLVLYFACSEPPDASLEVERFSSFSTLLERDGRRAIHAEFEVKEGPGAHWFPAGRGEMTLVLPAGRD